MRAGRLDDEALERANEVEAGDMKNVQEMKNMQMMKNMFGRRRYELMKDEDTEDYWGQDEDMDGFMSRLVELLTNDNVSHAPIFFTSEFECPEFSNPWEIGCDKM